MNSAYRALGTGIDLPVSNVKLPREQIQYSAPGVDVAPNIGHDKLAKKPYSPYGDLDIIVNMLKDRKMEETKRNLLNLPTEE